MVTLPILGTRESFTLNPSKIIALGLNYAEHVKESVTAQTSAKPELPSEPILFAKTPNVLIGPDEPIRIPKFIDSYMFDDPRTDYEAELALKEAEVPPLQLCGPTARLGWSSWLGRRDGMESRIRFLVKGWLHGRG